MSAFAPVVIFAYRRPEHLRNTLASLMRCDGFDESPVIVYCDGARDESELALVMATREVAEAMLGIRAEYRFSDTNQGLSRSVISGISETVERFGRVIVVEDDLELSVSFLTFMNRALEKYADEENIFQISGYQFNVPELRSTTTAIFLPFTVSWGWATWKRAWDKFDPLATGWNALIADKTLRLLFNLDGTYDYANMLVRQMEGYRDSWAIRWYWSVFTMNGLVLFPPVSLVKNMGFDGSGSHGRGVLRRFATRKMVQPSFFIDLPESVKLDAVIFTNVKKTLMWQNGGMVASVVDCIRRLLKY